MSSQSGTRSLVELFAEATGQDGEETDIFAFLRLHPEVSVSEKLTVCLADQSARWNRGQPLPVEEYLRRLPELDAFPEAKDRLVTSEYQLMVVSGATSSPEGYRNRFPNIADDLADLSRVTKLEQEKSRKAAPGRTPEAMSDETASLAGEVINMVSSSAALPINHPQHVGKYRILRVLGDGGFGRVYLALDESLDRYVAVKVPHEFRLEKPEDIEAYSTEAKVLAKMMHPAIVQVYDFDWMDDGRCYAVTGYIDGCDLAKKLKNGRLPFIETAKLVARVSEALHYSHGQGIIHRDVKPGNILIDAEGKPFVTDFGIALKVEDWSKEDSVVGTPAYMSPEQVRGESHLVDGRSDVFSLGVVLFEMLSGQRPFGRTRKERRLTREIPALRDIDQAIPEKLEQICLKAMAYRVADRYDDAEQMAQDLRHFIDHQAGKGPTGKRDVQRDSSENSKSDDHSLASGRIQVVSRGLRSFARDDAGFFLDLLPGLKDRNGVPESVLFWRQRIQTRNTENALPIGLIYGPSGCGKSSFLKAGLLPGLPNHVTQIFIQATPEETEIRLLTALRKSCPELPQDRSLSESMGLLREGESRPTDSKVLIVIDQFEQWLHNTRGSDADELVEALRQCDGVHLQCIISARDNIWSAVLHFMNNVGVSLVHRNNSTALDLFSVCHAEAVLTVMGRTHGVLPQKHEQISKAQKQFIKTAVQELAQDGKVTPAHLSLFAEMVKDKPWDPTVLRETGGTVGAGVTFLENTFSGPQHHLHRNGARAVLATLLAPESGTIKGRIRSYDQLIEAAGYKQRKPDFDALLHILDSELRLITPTEPDGISNNEREKKTKKPSERSTCFQLTHVYLMASVSEWVLPKKKETRCGRAGLLLTERTKTWQGKPSRSSLPSLLEWVRILCFTSRQERAHLQTEQQMMKRATRYHLQRLSVFGVLVLAATLWVRDYIPRNEARTLVQSLHSVATEDAAGIIVQLNSVQIWAESMLVSALKEAAPGSRSQLNLRLARLEADPAQSPFLVERMLSSSPETLRVISDALARHTDPAAFADALWSELEDAGNGAERRFRAAAALSHCQSFQSTPETKWNSVAEFVSIQLIHHVNDDRKLAVSWLATFFPVRDVLGDSLSAIYGDTKHSDLERKVAASILGEYTLDRPKQLMKLLLTANVQQHQILLPNLAHDRTAIAPLLRECFDQRPADDVNYERLSRITKRRAYAAALLFALHESDVTWNALAQTEDRELQSFLEDRLSQIVPLPEVLHAKLTSTDVPELRASLLRVFGGMSSKTQADLSPSFRSECVFWFESAFQSAPNTAAHSAAEWALKTWGESERVKQLTEQLAGHSHSNKRTWYISKHGHTMAKFRGPIRLEMRPSPEVPDQDISNESQTTQLIERSFAIGTKEVTMSQFLEFHPSFRRTEESMSRILDRPATGMNWHQMAAYCNWLSQEEGISKSEWCYARTGLMAYRPLPGLLSRKGFRLPTELEWELACRANTQTSYFWGNAPDLAKKYCRRSHKRNGGCLSVAALCPNSFGMFDMLGNASEMTQSAYRRKPLSTKDVLISGIGDSASSNDALLASRGSARRERIEFVRTVTKRKTEADSSLSAGIGFRVARTVE